MYRIATFLSRSTLLLATLLFLPLAAHAQFGASLSGSVQDSTGAVVPNAAVTLTNPATQQTRSATTSAQGAYAFTELTAGLYSLSVSAPGFKGASLNNVNVVAESPSTTDVTLTPGGSSDIVTVNADEGPALQTADASIGTTLTSEAVQRLPAIGGDVYELLRTAPGITGDAARSGSGTAVFLPNGVGPGQSNRGIFQTENQVQISSAGQQVGANDYLIDGVSVNSLGQAGAAVVTPNQESVGSLTIVSTSYSAEDGRNSGAHIKIVTKTGTNDIHGSLYFRETQPGFNAYARPFATLTNADPLRVNNRILDYAASLGGPIKRDKAFLFASFEGSKFSNNAFTNQFVETPQYDAAVLSGRAGTVTGQILASGGVTPRVATVLTPTCSYYMQANLPCAIVGNAMDVGSFGGPTRNGLYFNQQNCAVDAKGVPNAACKAGFAPGTGSYNTGTGLDGVPDLEYAQLLIPQHSHANQFNGRFDLFATAKDQFAASVYVTKLDNYGVSGASSSRPQGDVPFKPLNEDATFIYIHSFSPTLLNEFRANVTRFADNAITDGAGTVNYGIPYISAQNIPGGNNVDYGTYASQTSPALFAENTYEIRDTVSVTRGGRSLRFGGEYRWEQDNNNLAGAARPTYTFQGLFNFANNAPIYEGITADPTTGGPANTARYLRSETLGLFVQHDWKVTPTFTLNLGVRYEYFSPFHNKGINVNLPVLGPAGSELTAASLTPHNNFFNPDYTGITPKFGFAFAPASLNGKTVFRGGVARAMNRLNFSTLDAAVEGGPGYFSYGICCGTAPGDFNTPLDDGKIQYGLSTDNSPFGYAPNPALKTPTVNGLPVSVDPVTGATTPIGIEVYGAPARVKTPYAYLYSLETQTQLPHSFTLTVGFQGSTAHHLPRLVNQNFLYSQPSQQIFNAAYFLQTDSNSNYAGGNVRLAKTFHAGYQFEGTYTYSKSLDQISNGFGANSLANQTNPAVNATEYGPSDYDVRHRITASGLFNIPGTRGEHRLLNAITNGFQVNGIFTFHTGFPFTPVVANVASNPFVTNAATISPTRPYAYLGGFQSSCNNSFYISGQDTRSASFVLAPPDGTPNRPGIGRNSFTGPCYIDTDLSAAREQRIHFGDHTVTARFQANAFNLLNSLNLSPFTNGNAGGAAQIVGANPNDPLDVAARAASNFGRPNSADAGRQIEFFARIQF